MHPATAAPELDAAAMAVENVVGVLDGAAVVDEAERPNGGDTTGGELPLVLPEQRLDSSVTG